VADPPGDGTPHVVARRDLARQVPHDLGVVEEGEERVDVVLDRAAKHEALGLDLGGDERVHRTSLTTVGRVGVGPRCGPTPGVTVGAATRAG
jgi:hypothetical protein